MNEPLLDDAALQKLGERLRSELLDAFDSSGITSRSGTLRAALATARIEVTGGESGPTLTVTLDDRQRPPRPGESQGASTSLYGPRVFAWAAGRNAVYGRDTALYGRDTPMAGRDALYGRRAFYGRSVPTGHAANVVVMDLSASQTEEVKAELAEQVSAALSRALSRSE